MKTITSVFQKNNDLKNKREEDLKKCNLNPYQANSMEKRTRGPKKFLCP